MSTRTNIISFQSFQAAKALRQNEQNLLDYQARLLSMDKVELLDEMVNFQKERTQRGQLTLDLVLKGRHLFKLLEENAETEELRTLTRSYRRHLDHEYATMTQQSSSGAHS